MDNMGIISQIGGLLALCGIASVRCFMPTFLVCVACRMGADSGWAPSMLLQLGKQMPDGMLTDGGLLLLGAMAVLELVANWNETARSFFDEANWERYTKPLYAFAFALAVGAPEGTVPVVAGASDAFPQVVAMTNTTVQTVQTATNAVPVVAVPADASAFSEWVWTTISAGLAAFGTSILCSFRRKVADVVRSLDPDNSFKLQTLAAGIEETTWLAVLVLTLLVPALAIFFMGIVAGVNWLFLHLLKKVEQSHSHACPKCGGLVHDSALKCPGCREDQPLPYRAVAFCGMASRLPVDSRDATSVRVHHHALLKAHRCPICASPLKKDKYVCPSCETRVWEQGVTREDYVRALDLRMAFGVVGGVIGCSIPILGFVLTVMYLNMCVMRYVRAYEAGFARSVSRLIFKFFKWTMLIFAAVFSAIPFVGVLFLLPYVLSYWRSRSRFLR